MPSGTDLSIPQALQLVQQCVSASKFVDAEIILRKILAVDPNQPNALQMLGKMALHANRPEIAVQLLGKFVALVPKEPVGHIDLGSAYLTLGKLDQAIASYQQALALKPNHAGVLSNLGIALHESGRIEQALAMFQRAVELDPAMAGAWNNLANALRSLGRFDQAADASRKAIAARPDWVEAYTGLANALKDSGDFDQAIVATRQALTLQPNSVVLHSNLLIYLQYDPATDPKEAFQEHLRWNQVHAAKLKDQIKPHSNDRSPDRRLRVGYVSPDFREHSVSHFIECLLANHDADQAEVFCYADMLRKPDPVSEHIKSSVHHWHNITGLGDQQVAELIRNDGIDILVDLAGHTSGSRLLVFAQKTAPVQVSYLGYPNTTGVSTIDYYMTDEIADPPGLTESLFSEQLVRLPRTLACYRPPDGAPPVAALPAESKGYVTFASFNTLSKLNPTLLGTWAQILRQVPHSRLLIAARGMQEPPMIQRISQKMFNQGVTSDRLEFAGYQPRAEYLAQHHHVDVLLDSFPVNGHTITCHALWMGVPVICLAGRTHAGRLGASVLHSLGLTELLADSEAQYVQIAAGLAMNLERLKDLRSSLRDRMLGSTLMDYKAFVRDVEAAYRTMWRRWCGGETNE